MDKDKVGKQTKKCECCYKVFPLDFFRDIHGHAVCTDCYQIYLCVARFTQYGTATGRH